MTFADRVEQQRGEHLRSQQVADELRGKTTADLRLRAGISEENHLFYPRAYERLLVLAADRIARLEARLVEATTTTPAGMAAESSPIGERTPLGGLSAVPAGEKGREAASHAERGKR